MSRRIAIFAFWLLGFGIGFVGYLSLPTIVASLAAFLPVLNQSVIGALIAGIAGSAVSTFAVISWANKTTT